MTPVEVQEQARLLAIEYLEQEVDYDWTYEKDQFEGVDYDDIMAVHDAMHDVIRGLAKELRA